MCLVSQVLPDFVQSEFILSITHSHSYFRFKEKLLKETFFKIKVLVYCVDGCYRLSKYIQKLIILGGFYVILTIFQHTGRL